ASPWVYRSFVRHCLLADLFDRLTEGMIGGGFAVDDLGLGGGAHAPMGAGEMDPSFWPGWRSLGGDRFGLGAPLAAARQALLGGAVAEFLLNLRPGLGPAVGAEDGAQGDHRADMARRPMHAAALEASFHHQLAGALHGAAADRQAAPPEVGVLELGQARFQVAQ